MAIGKTKNKKRGFYLVEAIIAMFIVSVGLVATVELLSRTLKGNFEDRDQIIGVLLAQEGVELVRNLRDNNFIKGDGAFDRVNTGFPSGDSNACYIDKDSVAVTCAAGNNKRLFLNNGFYTHSGSQQTKFSRRITFDYQGGSLVVASIVSWGSSLPVNSDNCNAANKCAYAKVALTKWGE